MDTRNGVHYDDFSPVQDAFYKPQLVYRVDNQWNEMNAVFTMKNEREIARLEDSILLVRGINSVGKTQWMMGNIGCKINKDHYFDSLSLEDKRVIVEIPFIGFVEIYIKDNGKLKIVFKIVYDLEKVIRVLNYFKDTKIKQIYLCGLHASKIGIYIKELKEVIPKSCVLYIESVSDSEYINLEEYGTGKVSVITLEKKVMEVAKIHWKLISRKLKSLQKRIKGLYIKIDECEGKINDSMKLVKKINALRKQRILLQDTVGRIIDEAVDKFKDDLKKDEEIEFMNGIILNVEVASIKISKMEYFTIVVMFFIWVTVIFIVFTLVLSTVKHYWGDDIMLGPIVWNWDTFFVLIIVEFGLIIVLNILRKNGNGKRKKK